MISNDASQLRRVVVLVSHFILYTMRTFSHTTISYFSRLGGPIARLPVLKAIRSLSSTPAGQRAAAALKRRIPPSNKRLSALQKRISMPKKQTARAQNLPKVDRNDRIDPEGLTGNLA